MLAARFHSLVSSPLRETKMNKYLVELIGTFFLVLTIGCTVIDKGAGPFAPIAIGASLMVMIFAGGHISGGHYNPAVTLGVWMRGKCDTKDVVPYWASQFIGAALAAGVVKFFKAGAVVTPATLQTVPALLAEFLFTFALVYVVLNTATAKGTEGNSFYGLAIGMTVMGLSAWSNIWLFLVADFLGGAVAALIFKFVNPVA